MNMDLMRHELLLEIGVEEIPAGFVLPALDNLERLMRGRLDGLGLEYAAIQTAATPRRLAICVAELSARQPDRQEEFLGPARKAAFDDNNKPTRAAVGFASSRGCSVEDLEIIQTPKGEYVRLVRERKGLETSVLLTSMLPEVVQGLMFPKSMRWGNDTIVFVRPIQWVLALYNESVVPFMVGTIKSGKTTRGHRFMAPGPFTVQNYADYLTVLRNNHVLADCHERRRAVQREIADAVANATDDGIAHALRDEELVDIVTQLVEIPNGVCGVFDERFLALPDSVLITAMREHQKYFSVVGKDGKLQARFVAINNTRIADKKSAAAGHQRVLRARLEDALFFFTDDQRRSLADRVADLSGLIFQNKLGTMYEKSQRMVKLAGRLARDLAPEWVAASQRAALLSKADLLTAMVNEFPSLQGVMGRDYALLDEEEPEVAKAILEHYLPVRAGDTLPTAVAGGLVGMADRLDTIAGCFAIGQLPSGTADPFGLRRLALGLLHIIEDRSFSFSLSALVAEALHLYGDKVSGDIAAIQANIIDFVKGRFVNDLLSRGVPREAIEAVTSVSFDDVVDCHARINALVAIKDQPSFTILAAAFKRVMNIIKDSKAGEVDADLLREDAERHLFAVLQEVRKEAEPHLAAKEYEAALAAILRMKEPIDDFFDGVMVMVEERMVRDNRLNLLGLVARLFLEIGDFSKMHTVG
jgi:glycyl-tRNA synthetase beta chain